MKNIREIIISLWKNYNGFKSRQKSQFFIHQFDQSDWISKIRKITIIIKKKIYREKSNICLLKKATNSSTIQFLIPAHRRPSKAWKWRKSYNWHQNQLSLSRARIHILLSKIDMGSSVPISCFNGLFNTSVNKSTMIVAQCSFRGKICLIR